jgi:protease-4
MLAFFRTVFATFFAMVLFAIFGVVLVIGVVAGLARSTVNKQESKIPSGSYLVIDMGTNITDAPSESAESQLAGQFLQGGSDSVSLRRMLQAIHEAANDPRIGGIYLHGTFAPANYGSGYAALKEVREALLTFRQTHKPVVAYLVAPSTRDYYIASAADRIYLNPFGEIEMAGLNVERTYFAGALQKYGVGVQVIREGKYKSFAESYTNDKMSPEDREQTEKLIGDVWAQVLAGIEQTRKIPAARVQSLIDATGVIQPDAAKENGLVTGVAYLPEVIDQLRKDAGDDPDDSKRTFRQVDLDSYLRQKVGKVQPANESAFSKTLYSPAPRIALIYVDGEIEDGDDDSFQGDIAADAFARECRQLRQDPRVKAIVVRVNSPGGSVTGSEVIQREFLQARADGKPLIVSMGSVAASGGYWVTTAADRIFAEPNTITGSIGVVGLLPNIQQLANDHGVTFDDAKTGQHADLMSWNRPRTPEELSILQGLVDVDYQKFIHRVATARKLTPERVQEIAQGRVWSGADALKIGLVDEIGGLESALAYARSKAGLGHDAKIVEFPAPRDIGDVISGLFNHQEEPVASLLPQLRNGPLSREAASLRRIADSLKCLNDPRGIYARLPFDLTLD